MSVEGRVRAGFWVGIVVSGALLFAASRTADDSVTNRVLFFGGIAGIAAACIFRVLAARRMALALAERNQRRLQELERQVLSSGLTVEITGSSGLLPGLGAAAFAAFSTYLAYREPDPVSVACAVFFVLLTAILLPPGLAQLGRPLLRITRHGMEVGLYGTYAWHEIAGIDVQEIRHRGIRAGYQLILYVPDLGKFLDRMHPTVKLWYARFRFGESRNRLQLILSNLSESPEVIGDLLRSLWSKATGKPPIWSSLIPEKHWRTIQQSLEEIEELERSSKLIETDPERAQQLLEDWKRKRHARMTPREREEQQKLRAEMDALVAQHGMREAMKVLLERDAARRRELDEKLEQMRRRSKRIQWSMIVLTVLVAAGVIWLRVYSS